MTSTMLLVVGAGVIEEDEGMVLEDAKGTARLNEGKTD